VARSRPPCQRPEPRGWGPIGCERRGPDGPRPPPLLRLLRHLPVRGSQRPVLLRLGGEVPCEHLAVLVEVRLARDGARLLLVGLAHLPVLSGLVLRLLGLIVVPLRDGLVLVRGLGRRDLLHHVRRLSRSCPHSRQRASNSQG